MGTGNAWYTNDCNYMKGFKSILSSYPGYIYIYIYIYSTDRHFQKYSLINYKALIFTSQLHNSLESQPTRMDDISKEAMEDSRMGIQDILENLVRLESLLAHVRSDKMYIYISILLREYTRTFIL